MAVPGAAFGLLAVVQAVDFELDKRARSKRYLHDPAGWARDYLGEKTGQLWSKQREIMESVRDHRNTAVAAGHGVGKSHVSSIIAAWWVDVHPEAETFIATTAPSAEQLTIIWDGIRKIHGIAKRRYEEGLVDHPLPGYITGDNKWKMPDGTILGEGRKPPDNKSDVAFQGRHATYLLAIGDEAVGLSPGFLSALSNIATAKHNRVLLLANPTDPSSAMAKLWQPHITNWNRIHISVFESPMVSPDPDFDVTLAPALSGQEYIDERKMEWGEDDPRYIARVKGEWAFDAGNTVYTAEELANARRTVVVPYEDEVYEQGWDVARMGPDFTVGYGMMRGEVYEVDDEGNRRATGREGYHIRRIGKWQKAPLVGENPNNPGSANRIHEIALAHGSIVIKVDASGIGSGVIDGLADMGAGVHYIVGEVFGGAPSSDKRAYRNIRAENFFLLKRDMNASNIDLDPADEELFDELEGIQYEYADNGAIKIKSKEEMRKDGKKSPDHADAVWYARMDSEAMFGAADKRLAGLEDIDAEMDEYAYGAPGTGI